MGLEILEQVPDVQAIVVPIGGGGLIAGVALAVVAAARRARRSAWNRPMLLATPRHCATVPKRPSK
jgi:hypothetical protein